MYHFRRILSFAHAYFSLLKAGPSDAVYLTYEAGYGIIYLAPIAIIARMRGIQVWVHHHTSAHTITRSHRFAWLLRLLPINCQHIALSDKMSRDLLTIYAISSRNCVRCGNASLLRQKATPPDPPNAILGQKPIRQSRALSLGFISNISKEKGALEALALFDIYVRHFPDARLIVAGPLMDEECNHELTARLTQKGSRITYLGQVSGTAKNDFFEGIDVLVFPTQYQYEAQPLVVLESLEKEKPTLTTNVGYLGEMLSEVGWAYQPKDYQALAYAQLNAWTSDPLQYAAAAAAAKTLFCTAMKKSREDAMRLVSSLANSQPTQEHTA